MSLTRSGPVAFFPGRCLASCLRTSRHLLGYLHSQGRWASFLYHELLGALHPLSCPSPSPKLCLFSTWAHRRSFSHYTCSTQSCNSPICLTCSSYFSPCLNANKEICLRATESLDCLTLQLCQKNQMWGGETLELLVVEGYRITVGAKPLHVVDETFCSIPTDGANFWYLDRLIFKASAAQCKRAKKRV